MLAFALWKNRVRDRERTTESELYSMFMIPSEVI